jgi:hypothetical protein
MQTVLNKFVDKYTSRIDNATSLKSVEYILKENEENINNNIKLNEKKWNNVEINFDF